MREWVDPWVLSEVLRNPVDRRRVVSVLISRAQLDPDDGALALSEQLDYPAALTRHLERRDPAVVDLIPRELVRRWHVVPLGRARNGELVTVASDPTPMLAGALEHASGTQIALAVVPRIHIERLIRSVYGMEPAMEDAQIPHSPSSRTVDIEQIKPVVDGARARQEARTVSRAFDLGDIPELPLRRANAPDAPLEVALDQIDRAITLVAVERIAMAYAATRWHAALLLDHADGYLVGSRGHGDRFGQPQSIMIPLSTPSIVQRAIDVRAATTEAPPSELQRRLNHLLGDARAPAAAPVVIGDRVHGALLVGDPSSPSMSSSLLEVGRLVDAMSAAHERFSRTPR